MELPQLRDRWPQPLEAVQPREGCPLHVEERGDFDGRLRAPRFEDRFRPAGVSTHRLAKGAQVKVDDYKYLPLMFRSLYEDDSAIEEGKVWAELDKRLSRARVALLTSAGLYVRSQTPFDIERERCEPTWGDASHRLIPRRTEPSELAMAHLHVRNDEVLADPNIALPLAPLADLIESGLVGGSTAEHVSVMGYQGWHDNSLDRWQEETAPAIVRALEEQDADGVVLAPM